jgi:hypothetical protein
MSQTTEYDLTVLTETGEMYHRIVGLMPPLFRKWGTIKWERVPGPFDPAPVVCQGPVVREVS